MKTITRNTAVLAALLMLAPLAACSAPEAKAPNVTPAKKSEPEKQEPQRSERGNLIKTVGEPAGYTEAADQEENVVNFQVNALTFDPACTGQFAADHPAENGHLLQIDMEVATTPDLSIPFYGGPGSWKWIDPNGVTANGFLGTAAAFACFESSEMLPDQIGPGEKAAGKVLIDVPTTEGTLVFTQGGGTGWEWAVPGVPEE